ncbi:class I SAM-dependent methyltransferase [Desulfovibrio caledoniensis]
MRYLKRLLDAYGIRGDVAEIGYFHGEGSTEILLDHVAEHGGNFYSMDIFPDDAYYQKALEQLKAPNCHVLKGSSVTAGEAWPGGKLDFLFVDGDHGFPRIGPDGAQSGIALDVLAWHRHLNVGGLMVFHDYTGTEAEYGEAGVMAVEHAVDSLMREPLYSFVGRESVLMAFRKEREGVLLPRWNQKRPAPEYADAWASLNERTGDLGEFLIYGSGSAGKQVLDCIREVWGKDVPVAFTNSTATEPGSAFGCPLVPFAGVRDFPGTVVIASVHEEAMAGALETLGKERLKDFYRYYEFVGWVHVGRYGCPDGPR